MKKKDNNKKKRLIEYKIPFVLRDLDMGFNSATRERNYLEKLKYWQIIITTSLTTFLLSNSYTTIEISSWFAFVTLIINIIILYLEATLRWNIFLIGSKTSRQERLLEVENSKEFENNIINWEFGTGISKIYAYISITELFKKIIWNKSFLLWHLFFVFISLTPILFDKINWL